MVGTMTNGKITTQKRKIQTAIIKEGPVGGCLEHVAAF
jgi:hypothetical protein